MKHKKGMIAEYTGGDLAEIERAEEYGNLQEEAEVEILDGVHPVAGASRVADNRRLCA